MQRHTDPVAADRSRQVAACTFEMRLRQRPTRGPQGAGDEGRLPPRPGGGRAVPASHRAARDALALLGTLAAVTIGAEAPATPFGLADVAARAEQLAREPYDDPRDHVPEWLLNITYDQWRDIRFRPERALWRAERLPFTVQFFHLGLYYDHPVAVNVIEATGVRPVAFAPADFDYGGSGLGRRMPANLGYAGFRIHYPIKTPEYHDEIVVFLGGSYFRALGRRQGYGLSARGLAIDTVLPSGEEFPYFREFWLARPAPDATQIEALALLDSPSVTGAYRFVVTPGDATVVDVEARVFRRRDVAKLGIAPLTSMFFFGENTTRAFDDFRPEIHDSDGLLLETGTGEWLWRPLDNPKALRTSTFQMSDPRGFGLVQRDRDFDHYQDLETRAELRPSVWIVPRNRWGAGRVELIEIPTGKDTYDNVVTLWIADRLPPLGTPLSVDYTTYWYDDDPTRPPGGRAVSTRRDTAMANGAHRFVVDFEGRALAALPESAAVHAVVTVSATGGTPAHLLEQQVHKNPVTGGWRTVFQVPPPTDHPIELRAFLRHEGDTLTETWTYVIAP
jgi:glucans biosynthesis protein